MENLVKFKRVIRVQGGSLVLTIPQELIDFLETKDNDELTLIGSSGKKRKFLAIFKEG
jgi:antitoxin component of MazEF toxin-antitoxin module